MRSIFIGIIMLSASLGVVDAAQKQKQPQRLPSYHYRLALVSHQQLAQHDPPAHDDLEKIDPDKQHLDPPTRRDGAIGAGEVHSEEDALTKRIEQGNARLDHEIIGGICPSCGR
jgi:hypothetical protein